LLVFRTGWIGPAGRERRERPPWRSALVPSDAASTPSTLDWQALRAYVLRRIRGRLRFAPAETIEDLAQEVLVTLFRLSQREALANPEAFATTLVHRVCVDHVRRMRGPAGRLEPLPDSGAPLEMPAPDPAQEVSADMLELFRFVVLEHFERQDAACHQLAREFFAEHSWSAVAERLGLRHNTAIKRWSRCMERVRGWARTEHGPLWEWARSAGVI
jgi:DNA-directed RNA polymerase specialized sigma24 family protein